MISIECHKNLPVEYEAFLIDRYDSFLTNCRYIEIHYQGYDFIYMLVYDQDKLSDLLIFGNKGETSSCFNSLVRIDQEVINSCIKKVFENYPQIKRVKIDASYNKYNLKRAFLYSKFEDYILDLPTTMDEYYSMLGRSTRRTTKNRKAKLIKDYPNVKFDDKFGEEISETLIDEIIKLNISRMKSKGKTPGRGLSDAQNFYQYAKHYGCATYIEVNGRIIAASLSIMLHKQMYGIINAHDNEFSKYNAGEMCALYRIQTAIEKDYTTLHFLWGESDLKTRLLGKPKSLYSYYIYRAYSINYLISNIKSISLHLIRLVRHSKFTKPIREAIKLYRRQKLSV